MGRVSNFRSVRSRKISNFVFSKSRNLTSRFLEWRAGTTGTRKEGRKVLTEGWREGVPINNTPRRGATVATPITPIVTHVSLYTNTHVYTRGSDSPLKLLRRRERKLRTDPFPSLFLWKLSRRVEEGKKLEVTIFRCTFLGENWGPVNCTRKRIHEHANVFLCRQRGE